MKFARGYLANGQIKGLVDNLWRFQSFNARHKTPITAEGESEDPREGSRSSSWPSVYSSGERSIRSSIRDIRTSLRHSLRPIFEELPELDNNLDKGPKVLF